MKSRRSKADADRPWYRRSGETGNSHGLFLRFRDLGPGRSLEGVRADPGSAGDLPKVPSMPALKTMSAKHEWAARARAWDAYLQAARDAEVAKEAAKWEARRLKELEDAYARGEVFSAIIDQALKLPLVSRVVESTKRDGRGNITEIIKIEPAKWTLRDIAAIWELSVRIKAEVLRAVARDPAAMSDAELEATAHAGLAVSDLWPRAS